jgi:hypothetical protein
MSFKSFGEYVTEATKEITVAWGRYNAPTIGHEKLFTAVQKVARNSAYRIYSSQTHQNQKDKDGYYKDPLDYKTKVKYLRKMFPRHARAMIYDKNIRTMFDLMTKLYDEGFNRVNLVAGSDRVAEYESTLNKYNGVKGRHGFYNFEGGVNIISAGERDPDSDGASGMSASKLRAYASANDLAAFSKGIPKGFKDGQALFNDVRKGMGLKESHDHRQHLQLQTVSEEREAYIQGELFEKGDTVAIKESDEVGTVVMLGSNYVIIEMTDGKKLRKWLTDVEKLEEACWETHKQVGMKTKNGKQVPNCVPKEESDMKKKKGFKDFIEGDKNSLWDNIHKKRKRIKNGSGEKMNKPGSKDAPTDQDFKDSQ